MSQKLDDFNKILLATGVINYMASALNGVMQNHIFLTNGMEDGPDGPDFTKRITLENLKGQQGAMAETLTQLNKTIEKLGNYLDGHDIVCQIDARVYEAPLHILLHGQDDTEKIYE